MDLDQTNTSVTAPTAGAVEQAIGRGIAYLYNHQYPGGEFCCYVAADKAMRTQCVPDTTVLPTVAIAQALLGLAAYPAVATMLARVVAFLQYQMMRGGIVNFYALRNPLFLLLPPDADATACAGAFLDAQGVDYPRRSAQTLLLTNQRGGGGLFTWFVLRPRLLQHRVYWRTGLRALKAPWASLRFWRQHGYRRNDQGGVTNANVLHFLGMSEATRPVLAYLVSLVVQGQEANNDDRYRSPISLYYALGRLYRQHRASLDPIRSLVLERLLAVQQPDGCLGETVLETAQALRALIDWQGPAAAIQQAATGLLRHQGRYGEWPRSLYFYGGPKELTGWGSEELTTGFCLEALAAYQTWLKNEPTQR